jgi:CTP synthase (UTP-ammonia lyase)
MRGILLFLRADLTLILAPAHRRGIIVPGGFGLRGTEGMIAAIRWAREKNVPFLGICLGFQVACIEWARNVCGQSSESTKGAGLSEAEELITFIPVMTDAQSAELVPNTEDPVIVFMPEISKTHLGGTMRLGLRPTVFDEGTESCKIRRLYGGEDPIWERHRHRYEVNPEQVERLEAPGKFRFIGKDERGERMQVLEMEGLSFSRSRCSCSSVPLADCPAHVSHRPPILRRSASPPGILHPSTQPFTPVPRSRRRRMRARRTGTTNADQRTWRVRFPASCGR